MMIILGAVGGFIARQFWPWFRAQVDADFKARREALKAGVAERETRYLAAMEQCSAASKQHAEALERITAILASDRAVLLAEIDALHARIVGTRPRARPRKREETPT
jgi:uncharacterized protein involved in exopolysaccharide biosynthesis